MPNYIHPNTSKKQNIYFLTHYPKINGVQHHKITKIQKVNLFHHILKKTVNRLF